jgi:hypothetical protein
MGTHSSGVTREPRGCLAQSAGCMVTDNTFLYLNNENIKLIIKDIAMQRLVARGTGRVEYVCTSTRHSFRL